MVIDAAEWYGSQHNHLDFYSLLLLDASDNTLPIIPV